MNSPLNGGCLPFSPRDLCSEIGNDEWVTFGPKSCIFNGLFPIEINFSPEMYFIACTMNMRLLPLVFGQVEYGLTVATSFNLNV